MSRLGLMFFYCLVVVGCAGVQPVSTEDREFSKVVDVPGKDMSQIYGKTKVWLSETFNSAEAVIDHDSKEDGVIVGKGIIKYPCSGMSCLAKGEWLVPFTMKIEIKDQRFRMKFSQINLKFGSTFSGGAYIPPHNAPVSQQADMDLIKPALLSLADSLLSSMSVEDNSKNDDW